MEDLEKVTSRPMKPRKFLGCWGGGRRWAYDPRRGLWVGGIHSFPIETITHTTATLTTPLAESQSEYARGQGVGGKRVEKEEKGVHIYLYSKNGNQIGEVLAKVHRLLTEVASAVVLREAELRKQQPRQPFVYPRQPPVTFVDPRILFIPHYTPTYTYPQQPQQQQPPQNQEQQSQKQYQSPMPLFPSIGYNHPVMYQPMYCGPPYPPMESHQRPHPLANPSESQTESAVEGTIADPSDLATAATSTSIAENQPLYNSPRRTNPQNFILLPEIPPMYMSIHPYPPPSTHNTQSTNSTTQSPLQAWPGPPHQFFCPFQQQQQISFNT